MPHPLSAHDLTQAFVQLPGWHGDENGLMRTWRFADFPAAIAFMSAAAPAIDAANHHPEWTNVYNRVSVVLRTHDAGNRVTALDVTLAQLLDDYARRHGGQ
jgi:4a-hydroxytetrahydrobiopterin dehydratase